MQHLARNVQLPARVIQMEYSSASNGHEQQLCCHQWPVELQRRISRQRTDFRHLCDVIVGCEGSDDVFPAHRCVLAASSDYFCALFSSTLGDCVAKAGGVYRINIDTTIVNVSWDVVNSVFKTLCYT